MKNTILLLIAFVSINLSLHAQTLDPAFPSVTGQVNVAKIQGNMLYIGGKFTQVGGVSRSNLAAIDLTTKTLSPWAPKADGDVVDMEILNGNIYVCGHFTTISGIARNALAAIDSASGNVTNFSAKITFPGIPGMQTGTVSGLAIVDTSLYIVGYFLKVNNLTRSNFAKLGLPTGSLDPFTLTTDIPINLIEADKNNNILYVGGPFSYVNSFSRKGFFAVDLNTNSVLPWAPQSDSPGNTIYSITPAGNQVYISGIFFGLNGGQPCFAARTNSLGQADQSWAPFQCGSFDLIHAMSVSDSFIVAGGDFADFNGLGRKNLIRWDRATDQVTNWDPAPNDKVDAIAENTKYLVAGGSFSIIAGQPKPGLAVFAKSGMVEAQTIDDQALVVFPNPADQHCTVQLPQAGCVKTLEAIAIDGKVTALSFQPEGAALHIRTNTLPTGIYGLSVGLKDGKYYRARLVVSR